ncbi:MAG: hypothetical protein ACI8ZM_005199 [Crocinitomix sp.]|jgi:hypothetical protein
MKIFTLIITCFIVHYSFAQTGFTETSDEQGLALSYGIPDELSGGLTFCDFDQDGWDDLTFSTTHGDSLHFFRNIAGTFMEISIPTLFDTTEVLGVNWVDVDNDGDLDFFITSLEDQPRIFRNNGELNFTDVSDIAGIDRPFANGMQGCWGDVNNDSYLDVLIVTRIDSLHSYMYLNNGDFTFENISVMCGVVDTSDFTNCAGFLDYDNDNDLDIFIANDKDFMRNRLLQNDGTGVFTDVSDLAGVADSIDAMSVSVGDYNNDSHFDIYVTNTHLGNYFLKNNADGTFTNIAATNGTLFESIGWGAQWIDGDNDSWQDLYVSGMLQAPGLPLPSAYYKYDEGTETFSIPLGVGFEGDTLKSLANAMGDVNNDGFADLAIHNMADDSVSLYENDGNDNNWLKVNTEGTLSNRDGIGCVIKISTSMGDRYNFTMLGESYNGQNSFTEFFGLDTMSVVDLLTVKWPSGHIDSLADVAANQTILVIEGSTVAIDAVVGIDTYLICEGESVVLDAEGVGESYLWTTGETTASITVGAGSYSVEITNEFGFSESAEFVIIEESEIAYSFTTTPELCGLENGSVVIYDLSENVSEWEWESGDTGGLASGLGSGEFTITITDSMGCVYEDFVTISSEDGPEVSFYSQDVSCFGDADGFVSTFVSGTSPFTYEWLTGETVADIEDLGTGWYYITVEDENGCISNDSVFIDQPSELNVTVVSTSDMPGELNGKAWATVTGGTPAYNYFWNDPLSQITDTAWALPIGEWHVWVLDDKGCKDSMSVSIHEELGIADFAHSTNLLVYPNPSNGTFTISLTDINAQINGICIYDLTGKEVFCTTNIQANSFTYDQGQLSAGAYLLELKTNDKQLMFARLVIQ